MQHTKSNTQMKPLLVKEGFLVSSDLKDRPLKRGVSLFWSQWGGRFWSAGTIRSLAENWSPDFIRLPIGSHEDDLGYIKDEAYAITRAIMAIDEALANGVYVIVDCHDHDAVNHPLNASLLLSKIAAKYGDHPGILYEIVNEPLFVTWEEIKVYAEFIIPEIRRHAPNAVCLIGTPDWCTNLNGAFHNPVDLPNVMYTYHFYSASHQREHRENLDYFLQRDLPVFVSECGASTYTGNGKVDYQDFDKWLDFLETKHSVPWCAWSLMDKGESSSMLVEGACGMFLDQLEIITDYGLFMLGRIKNPLPEDENWAPYRKGYTSRFSDALKEREAIASLMSRTIQVPKALLLSFTRSIFYNIEDNNVALYTAWLANSWNKIDHGTRKEISKYIMERYQEELQRDCSPGNLWALRRLVDSIVFLQKGQAIA